MLHLTVILYKICSNSRESLVLCWRQPFLPFLYLPRTQRATHRKSYKHSIGSWDDQTPPKSKAFIYFVFLLKATNIKYMISSMYLAKIMKGKRTSSVIQLWTHMGLAIPAPQVFIMIFHKRDLPEKGLLVSGHIWASRILFVTFF